MKLGCLHYGLRRLGGERGRTRHFGRRRATHHGDAEHQRQGRQLYSYIVVHDDNSAFQLRLPSLAGTLPANTSSSGSASRNSSRASLTICCAERWVTAQRSEERREGKECVSTGRSRGVPYR